MKNYQVIIVGAGPAGLSAAMYFAKSNMETLVIGDGRTLLNMALLDNTYLGITEAMAGADFFQLATEQVTKLGASVVTGKVTAIQEAGERYEVVTEGGSYTAEYIVLASGIQYDTAELSGVELIDHDEPFIKSRIKTDERGRTGQRNVYAAGIAAGVASQAIVAAGHGAQVAINLLSDIAEKRVCVHDRKPRPATVS